MTGRYGFDVVWTLRKVEVEDSGPGGSK